MKKTMTLILTRGDHEEVVHTIMHEATANELGAFTPPVSVDHEDVEYILVREWHMMRNTFIYKPSFTIDVSDQQEQNRRGRRS